MLFIPHVRNATQFAMNPGKLRGSRNCHTSFVDNGYLQFQIFCLCSQFSFKTFSLSRKDLEINIESKLYRCSVLKVFFLNIYLHVFRLFLLMHTVVSKVHSSELWTSGSIQYKVLIQNTAYTMQGSKLQV